MRIGVALSLVLLLSACGSSSSMPETPLHVSTFKLQSKLLGKQLDQVLVTPKGGGKGRPLLVFLHGYGGTPADTLSPVLVTALRRLGDRAPVVVLPDGLLGWWHDRAEGRWGSYVLDEVIPAALARTRADPHRVAVGGISMGGFGALNLGRHRDRFCAVGGHSPAVFERGNDAISFGFDNATDFAHNDLLGIARTRAPYDAPVWIDVGGQDELRQADALLARELRARGADVSFHVWPGNHDGDYWNRHFDEYMKFYVEACN
ncbi:MAG TPA: alpha/beta hydrolase-fold protein [Gaiellaceae bacterium]|nr:alpha/beta hydrolase-fold protein [Gaiellaceae bacterium]